MLAKESERTPLRAGPDRGLSRARELTVRTLGSRFFYGWAVLGVAALAIFASGPGQSHTFSIFDAPIGAELGISATAIASAYGGATLAAALALPLMGRLLDQIGPRRMLLMVGAAFGLACTAFSQVGGMAALAIGFAVLRFLGQGSLMLGGTNLVAHWFSRKRGFALSLMALGFSASMAVHPPLAQWLIEAVGWRSAWMWLGLITAVLLLPAVLLLAHDRPEELGLRPDGERLPEGAAANGAIEGLTLHEALRTPAFYIVAAGSFSLSMLMTALHFFQASIFAAHGLGIEIAARAFPLSALVMVAAMPLIGRMLDRFPTHLVFAAGLVVMAATLITAALVRDLPSAIAYAVMFGVNNAVSMTFFGFLWPRFFGRRHLGSIQGTGQMIGVVGASLGPLPFGMAYDLFGSFNPALLGAAMLPLACAVLGLFLRAPSLEPSR